MANKNDKPVRFLILALPEASPAVLYGLYEVLASVGVVWTELTGQLEPGRAVEVTVVGEHVGTIPTALGFPVIAECGLIEAGQADVVIVPDLAISKDADPSGLWPAARSWLVAQARGGACMTSVCSGSVLLATSGLLDGKEATTHWAFTDLFRRFFPKVLLHPERVLCPAGDGHMVVTSGGAAAWSDLALYLIARFAGRARAVHAAKVFLLGDHSDGQLPFSTMIRPHHHEDAVIDRCQSWIGENYTVSRPVERMIEHSGLPSRTFKRRFRAATGYTPLDYVQLVRIEEAKQLLETSDLSIDTVSVEIGYEDPAFFRRLFRRHAGITPSRYRQRFRVFLG
jgi:transcriptional regulator GlxA family with amidase domain